MLTVKEQKRLKRYEEDLTKPKWKFILVYGLSFGVFMFIFTTTYNYFFDKSNFHWDIRLLISGVVMITAGGFLYGWTLRKLIKWYHKKLKSKID